MIIIRFRKCFKCGTKLPLFLFKINSRKYQIKSNLGRCNCCRFCVAKEALNDSVIRYKDNKPVIVTLSRLEIIKELFSI